MQNQSIFIENFSSPNKISEKKRYNSQAAFYALPKAFINRLLFQISGSTLKVFLALVHHTDCFNVIKYPDKITHNALMKLTGIRKKDTLTKAYKELSKLGIIGGHVPGHGSGNTKFYFTFDIDHYKTEECCLALDEISSYYEMVLSNKVSDMLPDVPITSDADIRFTPEAGIQPPETENEIIFDQPEDIGPGSFQSPLHCTVTIVNSWGTEINLYQYNNSKDFYLADGSFFCSNEEFMKEHKQNEITSVETFSETSSVMDSTPSNLSGSFNVTKDGTPYTDKGVQGYPEERDSLNTIKSYKINNLIVNARKDFKFIHEFNNFCIDDSHRYIKNTLFWLTNHAIDFNLSLADVTDSLSVANNKGKQGSMCYLIGIMRNKAGNNNLGIQAINKPLFVQAKEYFSGRFNHALGALNSYSFNWDSMELRYSLKNPDNDRHSLSDFFKFVVDDIQKAVGVSLSPVEVI